MTEILLELSGRPEGKGRPRFGKAGRVYTPKATKLAEGRIIDAWTNAGQPRLDGPVAVEVFLDVTRPQGHFNTRGELNAAGRRKPHPTAKPDVDNALKLVMDALNRRAYRDDVDVVSATVRRRWAFDGWECTTIIVREQGRDMDPTAAPTRTTADPSSAAVAGVAERDVTPPARRGRARPSQGAPAVVAAAGAPTPRGRTGAPGGSR